jgi:hypothetical protein
MKRTFVGAIFLSAFFATHALAESSDFVLQADEAVTVRNIAFELAPVKSQQTLRAYQSITPEVLSPLGKLSASARAEFLSSLTFNEKGLTGFNYRVLEDELTPSQAHSVLALFGAQRLTTLLKGARVETETDQKLLKGSQAKSIFNPWGDGDEGGNEKEYYCSGRATCSYSPANICMSSC